MRWSARLTAQLGDFKLDVDLSSDGQPLALIGANGSGKTSVLRLIAGASRPTSGHIQIGDRRLFDSDAGIDLPAEHRRVGYVPQGYGLFPHLSVVANVAFGLRGPRSERHARAIALLAELGCGALAERSTTRLSGGERQRIALARALAIEPQLMLLDEPLAALDVVTRQTVRAELAAHLAQRPAVVVTHDIRDVVALGARIAVLEAGRVVQTGTPDAVRAAPATPFAAEFMGVAWRA